MSYEASKMAWAYTRAHPDMDSADAFVLLALADRLNVKTRILCPSLTRLAADTHLSVATVQRAIKRLIERGLLVRYSGGPGKANRYMLTIDPVHPDHSHSDHSQDDHSQDDQGTPVTQNTNPGHSDQSPWSPRATNQERTKEKEPALSDAATPEGGDAHEAGLRVVVSKDNDYGSAHAAMREVTDRLRKKWSMPA